MPHDASNPRCSSPVAACPTCLPCASLPVVLFNAGSKALEYSNGIFDCQSPTSPFMGGLRALHLVEDLRGLLEMMEADEREGLRCQVPDSTAEALIEWLQSQMVWSCLVSPVFYAGPLKALGLVSKNQRYRVLFGDATVGSLKSCCLNTLCNRLAFTFLDVYCASF